jgi:hypothetical protein
MDYSGLSYDTRIELAITDLERPDSAPIATIAKRYSLQYSTLSRRWRGITSSRAEATSEHYQQLTIAQEEVLIDQINKLIVRKIPLTSYIVRNIAEEIINSAVGKNWMSEFVKRYKDRLISLYLRNIDNMCAKSEYPPMFVLFYELVRVILCCCCVINVDFKILANCFFCL